MWSTSLVLVFFLVSSPLFSLANDSNEKDIDGIGEDQDTISTDYAEEEDDDEEENEDTWQPTQAGQLDAEKVSDLDWSGDKARARRFRIVNPRPRMRGSKAHFSPSLQIEWFLGSWREAADFAEITQRPLMVLVLKEMSRACFNFREEAECANGPAF